MVFQSASTSSRRAIIAAGLGGLLTAVAQALARPSPARAGVDGDVVLGGLNSATTTTTISNTSNANNVFACDSSTGIAVKGMSTTNNGVFGSSGSGFGVRGSSSTSFGVFGFSGSGTGIGVYGESSAGKGVRGYSTSAVGVDGYSGTNAAVLGESDATNQPAIVGKASGGHAAVFGHSVGGPAPGVTPAKTGVYGYAAQDATARGIHGRSTVGRGVDGQATSGVGLYGLATSGYALRTNGKVRLDKSAGKATIGAGTRSTTVTPGVDLTTSTMVVATLQGSAGGTTTVHRVTVNPTANTFTIYLTANATLSVKVAWILLS
jgi:hypothetical protein